MVVWRFFLLQLTFALSIYGCDALDQNRLNTNTANVNLLLSESGRQNTPLGPINSNLQYPYLGQPSSTNAPNSNSKQTGKVHDLVNYYNNQGKGSNIPFKPLSYSSAVKGTKSQSPSDGISISGSDVTPAPLFPATHKGPGSSITVPPKHAFLTPAPNSPSKGMNANSGTIMSPQGNPIHSGSQSLQPIQSTSKPTSKPSFSSIISAGSTKPNSQVSKPPGPLILPSAIISNNRQGNKPTNSNGPSDAELQSLSEELLRRDTNNAAKFININYQEKTSSHSSDDKAPQPLITVPNGVYSIPTIQKFLPLLDNYERDTVVNEYVTPQERNEENAFMDAIMSTQVMRHLMSFLKDRGYVTPDPRQQRDFIKQMWFTLYARQRGKLGSSGFEHVFVSELKNDEILGLHNWLYYSKEELANRINYLGFMKYEQFSDKGAVIKFHFTQQGKDKPLNTMFIGTSPELEIALYSLCFITRADQTCPLKLGGKNVNIVTYTFRYRSKNMIGSAFPQI